MSNYKPLQILWETNSKNILHNLGYGPSTIINHKFTEGYAIKICEAVGAQYDIVWDNNLQVRLTTLWGCIQACYYSERYPDDDYTKIFTATAFQVHPMLTMWHIFYGIQKQQSTIPHDNIVSKKVQHMDQRHSLIYSYHIFYVRNDDQDLFQDYSTKKISSFHSMTRTNGSRLFTFT